MQKLLEEKYNFSKEDFLRYRKNVDSRYLFGNVVFAHKAKLNLKPKDYNLKA